MGHFILDLNIQGSRERLNVLKNFAFAYSFRYNFDIGFVLIIKPSLLTFI